MKRTSILGVILILLLSNLSFSTVSEDNKVVVRLDDVGSLSGYVTDALMNPIEGVFINITCGDFFLQGISYSTGRYYIGNVPIVDCYWNVSVSKNGYEIFLFEMSIDVNTSFDFVLTPIATTWYVDDDGNADYCRIQDGIDNASEGDTIRIYPGVYDENLIILKQIRIEGIDKENTIISASNSREYLMMDSHNYTSVFNLTFSCSNTERHDIIRMVNCSHCTIHDIDIFSDSLQRSAIIVNGSNNTIMQVTITGKFIFSGIELFYTYGNLVTNNSIDSSGAGILIHRSNNNMISSNTINNNTNGIYIEEGYQNIIKSNLIKNNNRGVFSSYSIRNYIIENNFIGNDEQARFTKLFRRGFLSPNEWDNNYWDDWKGLLIKSIIGVFYIPNGLIFGLFIPWLEFDFNPAKLPYDIS